MVRDIDGRDVITMGCIDDDQRSQLNCHVGSQTYVAIKCCNDASFCNRHLLPTYITDDLASVHQHHLHDDQHAHVAPGLNTDLRTCYNLSQNSWILTPKNAKRFCTKHKINNLKYITN